MVLLGVLLTSAQVAWIRVRTGYRVPYSWIGCACCQFSLVLLPVTRWTLVLMPFGIAFGVIAMNRAPDQFRSEAVSFSSLVTSMNDHIVWVEREEVHERLPTLPTDVRVIALMPAGPRNEHQAAAAGFKRVWVMGDATDLMPHPVWVRDPVPA